jgi:Tol biopolymer transport system component/DNA-binding winged helix-turn-helix (wHTH) protein
VQTRQIYSFGNFQLDADNRQLLRDDKPVSLSARAFDLLQTLLKNNGRLVEKDELFNSVWRDQIVEESNLTVHISQIRKALGENKNNPRYIETVPGYGYRFVGEVLDTEDEEFVIETESFSRITVEKVDMSDAEILKAEKIPALPGVTRRRLSAPQKIAVGALALAVTAGSIYWLSNRGQNNTAIAPVVFAEKQANIKRLTSKGSVNHGVLSPDGKFFAYSLQERGAYRSSLWLGQTNGNSDVRLLPAADLAYIPRSFSADGNWLYYTVSEPRGFDNGTLYKIPVLGGVPQELLSGINVYAVLSPDEKRAAFIRGSRENKTQTLVITNLDGSGTREIAGRTGAEGSFFTFSLSWSADGSMVAFAVESGKDKAKEIFTANTASGEVKQITALEWIGVSRLAWLQDGSGLLAVAREKNSTAANQLWRIDHESGNARRITRDLQHYGSTLSLSADSNELLAVQAILESHIWIAPAENLAAARQITFGSSGMDGWHGIEWTPGGKIIYTARIDQSLTLWTMDPDGANAKQITSAGFLDDRPSVTADGKFIVFQSNRSGAAEIWRMNSDGSDLRQLTFDGGNSYPHPTPDGKTIVYTHNANGANFAWRILIDGGEGVQITSVEAFNARVSPDGNFIACGSVENGKQKLAIVPITGGEPLKLFDVPPTYNFDGSIRWTRNGKSITYRDWANGVWQQNVTGGEAKRLEGLPAEKLMHFDWSPDGKQLAFTRGREVRDAVLITDFR